PVAAVEPNAEAMVAGFLAGVARRVPVSDPALACYGAGAREDRFQECRLAGEIRPNQCDAAGAAAAWAGGLPHGVLLESGSGKGRRSPRARAPELPGRVTVS